MICVCLENIYLGCLLRTWLHQAFSIEFTVPAVSVWPSACTPILETGSFKAKTNQRNGQNHTRALFSILTRGASELLGRCHGRWAPCLGQRDVLQIEPDTPSSHGAAFKIDPLRRTGAPLVSSELPLKWARAWRPLLNAFLASHRERPLARRGKSSPQWSPFLG